MTTNGGHPRVALVVAGGTLGTVAATRLDLSSYHETGRRQSAAELLDAVPELVQFAEIQPVDFRRVSSTALTVEDWMELVTVVGSLLASNQAVVIAHGTNTLEETAYFLDLCLAPELPVVLVGAMRPLSSLSSDGPFNLLRAVQIASSSDAKGKGVLIAMGDRIFAARDATKTSSQAIDAFEALDAGPIGVVETDGRVVLDREVLRAGPHFSLDPDEGLPRVDVVVSHVGADGRLIDAAVAAGARGIVSAGAGAGRPTPLEEEALLKAAESGVVVCLSSRVGSGSVVPTPAAVISGFVAARRLNPWKARILLALALTTTSDPFEIQQLFDAT